MAMKNAPQPLLFLRRQCGILHGIPVQLMAARSTIAAGIDVFAQEIGQTTGHSRTKIDARRPENQDDAGSHVFASVAAYALNYRQSAAVANGKPLAGAASYIKFA